MEYVFCTASGDIDRNYISIMEVQNLKKNNKVFYEAAMVGNIDKETNDQDLINVCIFMIKLTFLGLLNSYRVLFGDLFAIKLHI